MLHRFNPPPRILDLLRNPYSENIPLSADSGAIHVGHYPDFIDSGGVFRMDESGRLTRIEGEIARGYLNSTRYHGGTQVGTDVDYTVYGYELYGASQFSTEGADLTKNSAWSA